MSEPKVNFSPHTGGAYSEKEDVVRSEAGRMMSALSTPKENPMSEQINVFYTLARPFGQGGTRVKAADRTDFIFYFKQGQSTKFPAEEGTPTREIARIEFIDPETGVPAENGLIYHAELVDFYAKYEQPPNTTIGGFPDPVKAEASTTISDSLEGLEGGVEGEIDENVI